MSSPSDLNALKKEARAKTTSEARLSELIGLDKALERAVASSKHAPPTLLEDLAHSADMPTRTAVANNPNTPPATLEHLGWDKQWTVLKAVARHPHTPDAALERLSGHKQDSVREALWERQSLPAGALERLVRDPKIGRKIRIKFGRTLTPAQVDALLEGADVGLRSDGAAFVVLSDAQFEDLLGDPSPTVSGPLARNPSVLSNPKRLERALNQPGEAARATAVRVWPLGMGEGGEALERFVTDPSPRVRAAVAGQSATSEDQLERLSNDPDANVRAAIAQRLHRPAEAVLERLSRDPDPWVRANVVCSGNASPEQLERLSHDPDPGVRFCVAFDRGAPHAALERLKADPDPTEFPETEETPGRTIAEVAAFVLAQVTRRGGYSWRGLSLERLFGKVSDEGDT